jgi:hypothetical protein
MWKLQFPALDTLVSRLGNWRFPPWELAFLALETVVSRLGTVVSSSLL